MPTRRRFLEQVAASGIVVSTCAQVALSATPIEPDHGARTTSLRTRAARKLTLVRREETVIRHGGSGDNWHMSWGSDDRQYVSLCDGYGFAAEPTVSYNSRMLAIEGNPDSAVFRDLPNYPTLGRPTQASDQTRYYNFGTLALDGRLYQFMSTFNRPLALDNRSPKEPVRFCGVKLIYSPDNGQTWRNQNGSSPVAWESWDQRSRNTMVFFEEEQNAFSILSVLQMGRNYSHNRDGYVYVYAPNGSAEGTMNELVMFRVPKAHILNRNAYEYFVGMNRTGDGRWSKQIEARSAVHVFPKGWVNKTLHPWAWVPSVAYLAPVDVYLMASWGNAATPEGNWFDKPSYLGFWTSPKPWGPWTQIHEEQTWTPAGDANARAFAPQIAPKWIAADGRSFWLAWSDFQGGDEFLRQAKAHPHATISQQATMARSQMPFYGFNLQRVDLIQS